MWSANIGKTKASSHDISYNKSYVYVIIYFYPKLSYKKDFDSPSKLQSADKLAIQTTRIIVSMQK